MPLTEALLKRAEPVSSTSEAAMQRVSQYVREQASIHGPPHQERMTRQEADAHSYNSTERKRRFQEMAPPTIPLASNRPPPTGLTSRRFHIPEPTPYSNPIAFRQMRHPSPDSSIIPLGVAPRSVQQEQRPRTPAEEKEVTPIPEIGYDPYSRRARHKMKENQQIRNNKEQTSQLQKEKRKRKPLGPKAPNSQPSRGTTLAKLTQENEGRPVVKKTRLTLKPEDRLGLFKRGRASAVIQTKHALPDLSFSEMKFLSRDGPGFASPSQRPRSQGQGHTFSEERGAPVTEARAERRYTEEPPAPSINTYEYAGSTYGNLASVPRGRSASINGSDAGKWRENQNADNSLDDGNTRIPTLSPETRPLSRAMGRVTGGSYISDGHSEYSIFMRRQSLFGAVTQRRPRTAVSITEDDEQLLRLEEIRDKGVTRENDAASDKHSRRPIYVDSGAQYSGGLDTDNLDSSQGREQSVNNNVRVNTPKTIPESLQQLKQETAKADKPILESRKSSPVKDTGEDIARLIDACNYEVKTTNRKPARREKRKAVDSDELEVERMLQELSGASHEKGRPEALTTYGPTFESSQCSYQARPSRYEEHAVPQENLEYFLPDMTTNTRNFSNQTQSFGEQQRYPQEYHDANEMHWDEGMIPYRVVEEPDPRTMYYDEPMQRGSYRDGVQQFYFQ